MKSTNELSLEQYREKLSDDHKKEIKIINDYLVGKITFQDKIAAYLYRKTDYGN